MKRLPDKDEAARGVRLAADNAAGLLSDADTLAATGRYSSALSLVVLAFEESVKARTLGAIVAAAAVGLPVGFNDRTLRQVIYSGHKIRHRVGAIQHLAVTSAEEPMVSELARIISSMNTAKQLGFYVDFDPDSGAWTAPGNTTKAEFEEFRTLVGDYVNETKRQINASGL
ncbi:MAG TPA: AbiV family abortive infection protein [Candidatus Dormibacteraeota bacterium]|nr:AbiV family abortive infection protein [Candidatus Dormibacteraeota bacterium]